MSQRHGRYIRIDLCFTGSDDIYAMYVLDSLHTRVQDDLNYL